MEEVFISHRSNTTGGRIAGLLFEELRDRGVDSFLDAEKLGAGDEYTDRILDGISTARVVAVVFEEDATSWVHFEAACAFFDAKLVPVAVDGAVVPPPYDQIHHETLSSTDADLPVAVGRVADQIVRKLRARTAGSRVGEARSAVIRSLRWGWWVLLAIPGIWALQLGLTTTEWAAHIHLVLGSLFLGGLFFLPLSFSQALKAPSARARDAGFQTVDHAFRIWVVLSLLQPPIGLYVWFVNEGSAAVAGWLFVAMCAYATALAFSLAAYALIRSAHADDRRGGAGPSTANRALLAYGLFVYAFFMGVAVMSLMLTRDVPGWLG